MGLSSMGKRVMLVTKRPVNEQVLDAILSLRELKENEILAIKGRGDQISRAVDIYNELRRRLGSSLILEGVSIGSEKVGRKTLPFIEIVLRFSATA